MGTPRQLLDLMRANVQLNHLDEERVRVEEYSWGGGLPAWIEKEDVGMILAADCVYFEVSSFLHSSFYE